VKEPVDTGRQLDPPIIVGHAKKMEHCVAADPNKIHFSFLWTQLTATGPVTWLIAVGVTVVLLAMAWTLVR
jgi:hypothetical protein